MGSNYKEMLDKLDTFKDRTKDMEDFNEFMAKVNEIESIVKGLSSNDEAKAEESIDRADKYLSKHDKSLDSSHKSEDASDSKRPKSKKSYNRTVINKEAFEDDKKANEMSPDEFMKSFEEDAKRRAEDRKKRKAKAAELKSKAEKEFNSGNYTAALETYNQAISTLKDWAALYTGRAQTHLQLGNIKEAMSDCDWAFKADARSLNAHVTQGKAYVASKEFDKAIDIFQKALSIKPDKKAIIEGYVNEAKKAKAEHTDS